MKPYKACPPSVTINKIRRNLEHLTIFLKETSYSNNDCLYTSRVLIAGNMEPLNIGTNGKGISYEYALASGYAEFMERIQNYLLFKGFKNATKQNLSTMPDNYYKKTLIEKGLALSFQYDPREIDVPVETEVEQHFDILSSLFPFISNKSEALNFFKGYLKFKDFKCVPFYSEKTKGEIYLPIELLLISCGSNGMASGNTQAEALIQGFCEIFERYAGYQIYRENLTPPTIPVSEFKDYPIYNIIQKLLHDNDYTLIIKDCSLGIGLPVIGVLVIDEKRGKYNFNLGSALNPGIALERCITELYQSAEGLPWYDLKFEQYVGNPKYDEDFVYINGNKLFLDNSGSWSMSLFGQKPSYFYEGINKKLDKTDSTDLEFIKELIHELGFEIYIRNVSFLGLNSYYIIVPGMSQYPLKRAHYEVLNESYEALNAIRNIKEVPDAELKRICKLVNADYEKLKLFNFNQNEMMVYHTNSDLLDMNLEILFFMLNYKAGDIKKAYFYLNEFLKNKDFATYQYYYGIQDYVKLKLENHSDEEIENFLKILYGDETSEIIEDVKDPNKIMQYYKWPSCFKCEECEIFDDCRQFEFLNIMKKIQDRQVEADINHNAFVF